MRYGVLADVHGNLPALEAALRSLRRAGVDAYICAGDLVGYGAWPNECVETVAALEPIIVAGNHDLAATGRLVPENWIALARQTLEWTRGVLRDDVHRYLDELALRATVDGVVVAHGSLDDPEEYTVRSDQARDQLESVRRTDPGARVLVLGHTHRRAAYAPGGTVLKATPTTPLVARGPTLVNPGAVGQSRELRVLARFAVLDLTAGSAAFRATPYDVAGCREGLRRVGLPLHTYHLPPAPLRAAASRARRVARRALSRPAGSRR